MKLKELYESDDEVVDQDIDEKDLDDDGDGDVDADDDVGSVSEKQGFEKSSEEKEFDGRKRKVTILTKDETYGGVPLTLRYTINPQTGAWVFAAAAKGHSQFSDLDDGQDPSSLVKHLKRKRKVTPNQIVNQINLDPEDDSED